MQQGRLERYAPLTGIVFVVLIVVLFVIVGEETPEAGDPPGQIARFYADNDDKVMTGDALASIAVLLLVWFSASLRSAVQALEGGTGRVGALILAGGALAATGAWVVFGIDFAVADAASEVSGAVLVPLVALNNGFFLPLAGGWALFMLASGIGIVRTGALPRALGWIALLLGVCSVTPIGFFAILAGMIWVAVASVMLFLREGRTERPVAPTARAA
jgi:hypothetical protein